MDTKGNKENPGGGADISKFEHQSSRQESNPQKSIIQFSDDSVKSLANQILSAAGRPQNGFTEADNQQAKRFEIYSQAFAGFAQNNVSKSEGFAIGVAFKSQKTKEEYDKLTEELIKEKKLIDQLSKC